VCINLCVPLSVVLAKGRNAIVLAHVSVRLDQILEQLDVFWCDGCAIGLHKGPEPAGCLILRQVSLGLVGILLHAANLLILKGIKGGHRGGCFRLKLGQANDLAATGATFARAISRGWNSCIKEIGLD